MSRTERFLSVLVRAVFVVYLAFLVKLLFLSRVSVQELFSGAREAERAVNLIPFAGIRAYLGTGSLTAQRFAFSNVFGNFALFVPLGAELALYRRGKRLPLVCCTVLFVSLAVELIQGFAGLGTADIDDVILNTLGGILGVLFYTLVARVFKKESHVLAVYAVLSALALPVLIYYLCFIKLRL